MSDSTKYSWFRNLFLELFAAIDKVVYSLISFIYQIFFNVASSSLISGETIKVLFSRIQLILGIIIVFRLAVTLISGIVNPDKITDNKSGAGKLVSKIIITLILLIMIVPLNIPDTDISDGSYEAQLNNNGILFGTLYELQNRILSDNTLAKLVLGNSESVRSDLASNESMKDAGNNLAAVVLKSFITVNMAPGKENATDFGGNNRMCSDSKYDSYINTYLTSNDTTEILNLVTEHCDDGYLFNYTYILSTVSAIIMIVIMIGFTLDVAIRALKLAILRLIAPVPIIGSVDFKNDNNSLNTWGKTVSKTFIDLFLRLIVVFFIIFLLDEFVTNGVIISVSSGMVGKFTYVIIIIALFFFAKEFPKFMVESMGMKYTGGLFSGIGKMLGVGTTILGTAGAIRNDIKTQREENAEYTPNQHIRNAGRNILAAIGGTTGGLYAGIKGTVTAKDHFAAGARQSITNRNQLRASHSTAFGRMGDSAYSLFMGQSLATRDENIAKASKEAASQLKSYKSVLQEEAKKQSGRGPNATYGTLDATKYVGTALETIANSGFRFNYEELSSAMNSKDEHGNFTYNGETFNVSNFDSNVMNEILDSQSEMYRQRVFADPTVNGKVWTQWRNTEHAAKQAGLTAFDGNYNNIGKTIGAANARLADMDTNLQNLRNRANAQANKNKK